MNQDQYHNIATNTNILGKETRGICPYSLAMTAAEDKALPGSLAEHSVYLHLNAITKSSLKMKVKSRGSKNSFQNVKK